VYSGIEN